MIGLRLVLLCCVLYGYANFFHIRLGIERKLTWLSSASFIILVLYFSAYRGLLYEASIALVLLGSVLFVYDIYQLIKIKAYRSIRVTLLGSWLILYFSIFASILLQVHLDHYDNYSHWALIVKFLYTEGHLPDVGDTIISYTSYPMGSSLFIYFGTVVAGFNDQVMIFSQFLLIFFCILALFSVVRDESRALILGVMFTIIAVFNYFNIAIRTNNLLVDFLLPLFTLAAIAGMYRMRKSFGKMTLYMILVTSVLMLIKSSAIFFSMINVIYYFYLVIKLLQLHRHKSILLAKAIGGIAISFSPIILWNNYVKVNFPVTKHEVDLTAYSEIFLEKDSKVIKDIIDNFIQTVFNIDTLSTQGVILTLMIMLGGFIVIRYIFHRKNPLLWQLALISLITIVYYMGILLMFLFSMPTDEALQLAGFERYASSIVNLDLGMAMIFLARQIDYTLHEQTISLRNYKSFKNIQTKKIYQFSSVFLLFVSTLILLSETSGILYNDYQRDKTVVSQFEHVIDQQMELTDDQILVVSTNQADVENYLVGFVGKYWLYSPNVVGQENFIMEPNDFITLLSEYDKVLILEDHFTFNTMTRLINNQQFEPGLYEVDKILSGQ